MPGSNGNGLLMQEQEEQQRKRQQNNAGPATATPQTTGAPTGTASTTTVTPRTPQTTGAPAATSTATGTAGTPTVRPATQTTGSPAATTTTTPTTGSSSNTTTATPSNTDEVIEYLQKQMEAYKPETDEQRKKRERNEKWSGIISGISDAVRSLGNLYFTSQQAPNMYDGKSSMSAKAQERFDKAKAERQANADKYMNYALTLGRLKDAKEAKEYQRQQDAAAAERAEREWQLKLDMRQEAADREKRNFEYKAERDKADDAFRAKQFEEGARQFNVQSKQQAARLSMEAKRLAAEEKKGQYTFSLGSGNGNVTIPSDRLNAQTIGRIFATLPKDVRDSVHGKAKWGTVKSGYMTEPQLLGYEPASTEAMLIAIGEYVSAFPVTQNAIRELAGMELTPEQQKAAEEQRAWMRNEIQVPGLQW